MLEFVTNQGVWLTHQTKQMKLKNPIHPKHYAQPNFPIPQNLLPPKQEQVDHISLSLSRGTHDQKNWGAFLELKIIQYLDGIEIVQGSITESDTNIRKGWIS